MGGPAMIEGGGLGVLRARRGRPDRRAGRQRRRRPARRRRRRGGRRGQALPVATSAAPPSRRSRARPGRAARADPRAAQAHLRRPRGRSTRCSTRTRARAARAASGAGCVTALARVDGRPLGVIANDPTHLGGAIDADGADKAARFMQLCDAFELPVLFLCDTPGLHGRPGRRAHRDRAPLRAHVRHRREPDRARPARSCCARATASARRRWPAGGFKAPLFTVALADVGVRRDGPRGRGAARHAPRARRDRGPGRARARCSSRRSPPPTSAARASTWPPTARSTT